MLTSLSSTSIIKKERRKDRRKGGREGGRKEGRRKGREERRKEASLGMELHFSENRLLMYFVFFLIPRTSF